MPVCTDLLTIGDGTVIRKDAVFPGYRAHAGVIQTGAVTLGKDVFVGELAVLDIDTSLGDGAQLGHASSLRPGQAVPAGERWHGSPAQPTDVDYRSVGPARCGGVRRVTYAVTQLLTALLVFLPLTIGRRGLRPAADFPLLTGLDTAPWAFTTLDVLSRRPDRVGRAVLRFPRRRPARGVHGSPRAQPRDQAGHGLPPLRFPLLDPPDDRAAHQPQVLHLPVRGQLLHRPLPARARIRPVRPSSRPDRTSAPTCAHETPFLSPWGAGRWSPTGCRSSTPTSRTHPSGCPRRRSGPHSFLGNNIAYPAAGPHVGENCLLATKVMVPIDGQIREGVGLLGVAQLRDPADRRPRRPVRSLASGAELRRRLSAKNRYNLRTMALALLARWLYVFGLTLLAMAAADFYQLFGPEAVAARTRRGHCCSASSTSCWSNALPSGFRGLAPTLLLDLRPLLLVARALLEARAFHRSTGCLPAPRSRTRLAAAGRPARPAGLRRRLPP